MAIVLNNDNNKALRDLLHTVDTDKRLVIYYGVGEVVAKHILDQGRHDYSYNPLMELPRVCNGICELAIVDRDVFINICKNILLKKLDDKKMTSRLSKVNESTCLLGYLGVYDIYTDDVICKINSNFNLFRDAVNATLGYFGITVVQEDQIPDPVPVRSVSDLRIL